ncbi:uncharacterized protein LOC108118399 [Drosophila eugracilis]|uniref:uncharacterized protein LOC108118399 n=1 Tax=Drosophila eugracilis TaxID=29029 RepID=UPI001BD95729|nr:uncharacterized protein LOC108118399 [Drosophila eugracilis]
MTNTIFKRISISFCFSTSDLVAALEVLRQQTRSIAALKRKSQLKLSKWSDAKAGEEGEDDGKKLHFVSPARRKSVLAPILNKIKNGADAADSAEKKLGSESSGSGHIAVQIEPARRVKVGFTWISP